LKSRLFLAVMAVAFVAGADEKKNDQKEEVLKKELKNLEGTWMVESITFQGKPDKEEGGEFLITADKITMKKKDGTKEAVSFKIDPSKKPKVLDFIPEEKKENAAPGKAIYDLDGDTLKICVGPPDKRPEEISDKGSVLFTLKRKKAKN
jgi:uncharacterized protein (TIGR03067 family)